MSYILFYVILAGSIFITSRLYFISPLAPQYYYFCILMFGSSLFLLKKNNTYWFPSLSKSTVAACCFGVLVVSIHGKPLPSWWVTLAAVLCWAFFCIQLTGKPIAKLLQAVYSTGIVVAAYGLLQVPGWIQNQSVFSITLPFDNPAGFAATIAVIFPIGIYWLLYTNKSTYATTVIIIGQFLLLASVCLSGSRTGVLSMCTSTGLLVLFKSRKIPFTKALPHRKTTIGLTLVIVIAILTLGLYFLNKDSANGRLLIWQISSEMIRDNPLWGHGPGDFKAEYMEYQADFFRRHHVHPFRSLAGNVTFPFNTFILIAVEYGLVGLLLVLLGLFYLIRKINTSGKKIRFLSQSVMGGFIVIACFSYPLRYVPLWLLFIFFAVLGIKIYKYTLNPTLTTLLIKSTVAILAIGCLLYTVRSINVTIAWNKVAQNAQQKEIRYKLPVYKNLYPQLQHNALFLYNYGALLNANGQYKKSIAILSKCKKYFNDYDIQLLLAENYKKIHKTNKAITHYKQAAYMIPNRFWPLYMLVRIYKNKNEESKAVNIAKRIINKKVKISSPTIISIKNKMKRYVTAKRK